MDNNTPRYYEFGDFRLDARRRILFKNGEQTPLSTRICDLLLVMVQNEGRVLEHDELLDKVWEGMFVEQANLKKCVSTLRHILGEQPNESLYIKTIPRRGYSFIASVRTIADDNPASGAFYLQQTDTEIIIEEEIIEDDEIEQKVLPAKPQTFFSQIGLRQILVVTGIILLLGGVVFGLRSFFKKDSISFSAENVRITKLTSAGNIYSGGISADGNYVVYSVKDKDGLASLWNKQVSTDSATRVVQPIRASFYSYIFSPDGNYIYYTLNHLDDPKQNGIYRVPALGGVPTKITDRGLIKVFTLDSKEMILTRDAADKQTEILITDLAGNNERQLAIFDVNYRIWDVRTSPDGDNLLIALRHQFQNKVTFRVSEIPLTSNPQNLVMHDIIPEQEKAIRNAMWLPDKSSLLLSVRETNAEIVQLWQYFPSSGEWRRITNDNNSYSGIDIFKQGNGLITTQIVGVTTIWLAENGSEDSHQIGSGSSIYLQARWMNDGRILFSSIDNQKEILSIMSPDGLVVEKLTLGNDGLRLYPHLSIDNKFVSFVSSRSGTTQIWRLDLDSRTSVKMTDTDAQIYDGIVLADRQTVVYEAYIKPKGWILLKQTPDGKTIHLTESEISLLAISSDEKKFAAFIDDEKTGKAVLSVCSLEDGTVIKTFDSSIHTDFQLRFTPDNKGIAYILTKNNVSNIIVQPIDGSEPKQITNFRSDIISFFDWSPDGKNLLFIRGNTLSDAIMIKSESGK